ncbi:MAG: 4-hydroxy-tetrahydrodipicolinate synthase [Rhodospirillaceae bacterium]|nr:4-hydroxy-tetrahydrodipicolinate synthase [Rhodospirillaceae bacterium]MDE0000233.1 4-hydroxy-tetrahydrodipicolinate synthase [Rhodospirillaceae bacterium]
MSFGNIVALVTPMNAAGDIDESQLARLVEFHLEAGTEGFVIAGTTGESATLARDEHIGVIERACELVNGRAPVIAGTGSNSTAQTLDLSRAVDSLPVAGYLLVTPYYNKPGQEGMYRHFCTVADAVSKPVILYNVPSRTGVDLTSATVARLARHGNISGIKEATGELGRVTRLRRVCGKDFVLLSGDDLTACEFMLRGGDGVISVTANAAPAQMRALCDAARSGERIEAERIDGELGSLHRALFVESNPIPVKWAVEQLGFPAPGIRLPLTRLAPEHRETLRLAMAEAGVEVHAP